MVSLVSLLINLLREKVFRRKKKIIQVRRIPPTKSIRAHLLGLTTGFLAAGASIALGFATTGPAASLVLLLWFALATYFSGLFLLLTLVLCLLSFSFLGFEAHAFWYFAGYGFGALFAILYNDLVFLFVMIFERDKIKIAFAYDPNEEFNIIKSPIEAEERALLQVLKPLAFHVEKIRVREQVTPHAQKIIDAIRRAEQLMHDQDKTNLLNMLPGNAGDALAVKLANLYNNLVSPTPDLELVQTQIEPLVEKYLQLKEQKLYNYSVIHPPVHPYTIAFVANPKILKRGGIPTNDGDYYPDPIGSDLELFLRSVDWALYNFEHNEVMGRPEIWSRVRVITIFNPDWAEATANTGVSHGLLEEFQDTLVINNRVIDNLLDPMPKLAEKFKAMLEGRLESCDIDVIFAMSASRTHDRSAAHYADLFETGDVAICNNAGNTGKSFDYNPAPPGKDPAEIISPGCPQSDTGKCMHEHHAQIPGRIALNVLGARGKTYIHEFAHAMSSAVHGAIVDEYADEFVLTRTNPTPPPPAVLPFYVNRIVRTHPGGGSFTPVHKAFAEYNKVLFHSDLEHPSAEEGWLGYYPERDPRSNCCTMDRTYGWYRFDQLISNFMYDRVCAKLNR